MFYQDFRIILPFSRESAKNIYVLELKNNHYTQVKKNRTHTEHDKNQTAVFITYL